MALLVQQIAILFIVGMVLFEYVFCFFGIFLMGQNFWRGWGFSAETKAIMGAGYLRYKDYTPGIENSEDKKESKESSGTILVEKKKEKQTARIPKLKLPDTKNRNSNSNSNRVRMITTAKGESNGM